MTAPFLKLVNDPRQRTTHVRSHHKTLVLNAPNSSIVHAVGVDLKEGLCVEGFDSVHLRLFPCHEEQSCEKKKNAEEQKDRNDDSDAVVKSCHVDATDADGYDPRQYYQSCVRE